MKKSRPFTEAIASIVRPWSIEMAHWMGVRKEGNLIGLIVMMIGLPLCFLIGLFICPAAWLFGLILLVLFLRIKTMRVGGLGRLSLLIVLTVLLSGCDNTVVGSFAPLGSQDSLSFKTVRIPKDNELETLFIYSSVDLNTPIFKYQSYSFGYPGESLGTSNDTILISASIDRGDGGKKLPRTALLRIDGKSGRVQTIYESMNFTFVTDPQLNSIAIFDYLKSDPIPTFDVYKLPEMKLLKKVAFPEFKGKGMGPLEFRFEDGKYVAELSAELRSDKHGYERVEIPMP